MSFFSIVASSGGGKGSKKFKKKDEDAPAISFGTLIMIGIYLIWIAGGTCWFALMPAQDLGWFKGFFMAVNIGYSIGYGDPGEGNVPLWYLWFSVVYVIIGASFVSLALGKFADRIVEDTDNWFTNMLQRQEFEAKIHPDNPFPTRAYAFVIYHREVFRTAGLFVLLIGLMTMYSMINTGWSFVEGLYFAISSCSTGGHWALPPDTAAWMYGVTGVFDMIGAPLMAIALASLATLTIDRGNMDDIKNTIAEDVTAEELLMLQKFGLENGDGEIDKAEYIILCMVRLGTDPRTIDYISDRFNELDKDGGGTLSIEEVSGGKLTGFDLGLSSRKLGELSPNKILKTLKKEKSKKGLMNDDDDEDEESPAEFKPKKKKPTSQTKPFIKPSGYAFPNGYSNTALTSGDSDMESTESNTWC